jgi:hypothetical protein
VAPVLRLGSNLPLGLVRFARPLSAADNGRVGITWAKRSPDRNPRPVPINCSTAALGFHRRQWKAARGVTGLSPRDEQDTPQLAVTPGDLFARAKTEHRSAQIEENVARYLSQLDTADLQEPSEALAARSRRLRQSAFPTLTRAGEAI